MNRLLSWVIAVSGFLAWIWLGFFLYRHAIEENDCVSSIYRDDPWYCNDNVTDVLGGLFWIAPFLAFLFWLSRRQRDR